MKMKLLKFAIAIAICFPVHISVVLFSNIIVNGYIINTRLANFTIYDGYADFSMLLAFIPLSALLVFDKIKGNYMLIALTWFVAFVVVKVFVIDVTSHYFKFYANTQQNGAYSFDIFKDK